MKGICCIFNYAAHYRLPIYERIASEMGADFYFGANLPGGEAIEKLDFKRLEGFRKELKVRSAGPFRWSSGWLKIAFSKKYDRFLITQDLYAVNQWLFLIVCRILGKKVYVWGHGLKARPPKPNGSRSTRFLRSVCDKGVAGYFLYSDRAKENMILAGFAPERLHVVYNSLDYENGKACREIVPYNPYKEYFGNGLPVLVFIGRLTAVKRLDRIIEAYNILKKKNIETNVAFIGDGPVSDSLRGMIKKEDAGHFLFTGPKYDENEIHSFLYHATLCLSPGNVGLTAVNSLSHGLPVITNDDFDSQMPEYEAITPGVTGDFFQDGDIGDFAARTGKWIERLSSHAEREAVRKECYKVIDERYNPEYQIKVFKTIINEKG